MSEIADTRMGCDMAKVTDMRNADVSDEVEEWNRKCLESIEQDITRAKSQKKKPFCWKEPEDSVSSPSHYTENRTYEPRKVIHDWELNFNLGNVVKYVSRAGKKEGQDILIDLYKARQYLEFEIEEIENARKS